RDGFVLGEGSGSLFLEDLELAKARGAHIYAEVVGYGSAADGWDMIQPVEHGAGSSRAMKMALDRRGVPADGRDPINPPGTVTSRRDAPPCIVGPRLGASSSCSCPHGRPAELWARCDARPRIAASELFAGWS